MSKRVCVCVCVRERERVCERERESPPTIIADMDRTPINVRKHHQRSEFICGRKEYMYKTSNIVLIK